MTTWFQNLRMFALLTLLTGVVYPLVVTLIAQGLLYDKAQGSQLFKDSVLVGTEQIGQSFKGNAYFWPRPSAAHYDPLHSGGSNLGPTSKQLKADVESRKALLKGSGGTAKEVPSDLVYASGSGLDPHITLSAANFQVERILKSRPQLKRSDLIQLIEKHQVTSFFGGSEPYIHVLKINLALDSIKE